MYLCIYILFQWYTIEIIYTCLYMYIHTYMFGSDGDVVWPTELQGMKLGNIVQDIREDGKMVFGYKDRMQKLNDLGFSWEV